MFQSDAIPVRSGIMGTRPWEVASAELCDQQIGVKASNHSDQHISVIYISKTISKMTSSECGRWRKRYYITHICCCGYMKQTEVSDCRRCTISGIFVFWGHFLFAEIDILRIQVVRKLNRMIIESWRLNQRYLQFDWAANVSSGFISHLSGVVLGSSHMEVSYWSQCFDFSKDRRTQLLNHFASWCT